MTARQKRKRFGQHFLIDRGVADDIIRHFAPESGDIVLEIGPGKGILTKRLVGLVAFLTAVEIDARLAAGLELQFASSPGIRILQEDILRCDVRQALQDSWSARNDLRVISNLPYSIASPIIARLFKSRECISDAVLMVQREMADRALASPGSKLYGPLSILFQYNASAVVSVMNVSRKCFRPVPEVDSSLLKVQFRKGAEVQAANEEFFFHTVRTSFQHRRKTILNSLLHSGHFQLGRSALATLIESLGLDPDSRPEQLSLSDFAALSNALLAAGSHRP